MSGRFRWIRWVVLPLLGALLFAGGALAYDLSRAPQYSAEALVAVLPADPANDVSLPITDVWVEIANSDVVLDQVAADLDVTRAALTDGLTIETASEAPLVSMRASTGDAAVSARWAEAVADELLDRAVQTPVPGFTLQQVAEAQRPETPDPSITVLLVAAAAVLGAVAGAAVAQLLSSRDRRRAARAAA